MAKELAGLLCEGTENTVAEGQEPAELWDLLGGKTAYASDKRYRATASPLLAPPPPRLAAAGDFRAAQRLCMGCIADYSRRS